MCLGHLGHVILQGPDGAVLGVEQLFQLGIDLKGRGGWLIRKARAGVVGEITCPSGMVTAPSAASKRCLRYPPSPCPACRHCWTVAVAYTFSSPWAPPPPPPATSPCFCPPPSPPAPVPHPLFQTLFLFLCLTCASVEGSRCAAASTSPSWASFISRASLSASTRCCSSRLFRPVWAGGEGQVRLDVSGHEAETTVWLMACHRPILLVEGTHLA